MENLTPIREEEGSKGPPEGRISPSGDVPTPPPGTPPRSEEWASLFGEMATYLSSYLDSKIDSVKLKTRETLFQALLLILLFLVAGCFILVSVVLLMYGAALGLEKALGIETWTAFLITGGSFLTVAALSFKWVHWVQKKRGFNAGLRKYGEELEAQRKKFGHDAMDRATHSTQ